MSVPFFDPKASLVDKLGRPSEIFWGWLFSIQNAGAATTVANLPMTNLRTGDRGFVTDCATTTFAEIATGGGSSYVPVYWDSSGTATWRVG